MKKQRHGIPLNRKNPKYEQENPGYPDAGRVKGTLKRWGGTWNDWIGDLAGELKTAIEEYPEADQAGFEEAKGYWDDFGNTLRKEAKQLLAGLHKIYPPDQVPQSEADLEILGDATKPPPPPFGGGGKGEDDDGDI